MTHLVHTILPVQAARQVVARQKGTRWNGSTTLLTPLVLAGHVSTLSGSFSSPVIYKNSLVRRRSQLHQLQQQQQQHHIRTVSNHPSSHPQRGITAKPSSSLYNNTNTTTTTMAPNPVDIAALTKKGQDSDIVSQIASILGPALNDTPPTAETVANDLSKLYASSYSSEDKAEAFFWELWNFYLGAVRAITAEDPRQELLVSVVEKLKAKSEGTVKIWGEDTNVWGDLPLFGSSMREEWNFTPKFDGSEQDNAAVQSYISLNSFAARILAVSQASWINFSIWALREALEQDHKSAAARDGNLVVAHEWIVHAGKTLRTGAFESQQQLTDVEKRMLKGGPLFEGEPGLSEKRWAFWQQRVEDLAKQAESEEARAKANKTLETIKSLGA